MSHTSSISAVKIVDIQALHQAVEDLRAEGINIEVRTNEVPKAYYNNQEGMSSPAAFVLKIEGADYDVGIYDIGAGQHECRTDFYGGTVANKLGASREVIRAIDTSTPEGKEEATYAQLGRLYQRYSINATKNTAAINGGTIEEVVQADGSVQLRVTSMAS